MKLPLHGPCWKQNKNIERFGQFVLQIFFFLSPTHIRLDGADVVLAPQVAINIVPAITLQVVVLLAQGFENDIV